MSRLESAFLPPPGPFAGEDACAAAMAYMLIRIHGSGASDRALSNVTAMRARSDCRGAAFWLKAFHAIDAMATYSYALHERRPGDGEPFNLLPLLDIVGRR